MPVLVILKDVLPVDSPQHNMVNIRSGCFSFCSRHILITWNNYITDRRQTQSCGTKKTVPLSHQYNPFPSVSARLSIFRIIAFSSFR